jgi:hypothetical protein
MRNPKKTGPIESVKKTIRYKLPYILFVNRTSYPGVPILLTFKPFGVREAAGLEVG